MAKQLNVNLAMTADTSQAKRELQALQKQLDSLMLSANKKDTSLGISEDIKKATALASQLKVQLESATTSTGNLDLSKFNLQLQKSGTQLSHYREALQSLGPEGTKAFSNLASSIIQAEVPLRRSSKLLSEFRTTLINTARWQISSSILHGFMGALQGAYGYAKDLNESLNNIRIVTGQSIDQMARFADQANRAAKELSTTTTAYTDAALIYYQQGLSDDEVKRRTDVTVKMANVSRQSAEEVSSQMTAIWNNFDDGSKSLEYYADVITKLGASTAASSEEIAGGLEKFAAVADTVGLSYEKATAALATVVAETRQSADVVGTAFKTMFARFQGLSLGETLEDGVDLNKYSKALAAVGVSVLNQNGTLKEMDTILDELGQRWNQISNAQQVALAETVAGTRQYAQLMALMNNYDKVLANQNIAAGSEGTLQAQADIFAEGWEAAAKRVRAAAQGIYKDLLDDKAFIKMLNWVEKLISFFDKLIENMGGLRGLLLNLGTVLMTTFGPQIQANMQKMVDNLRMMSPAGRRSAQELRKQAASEIGEMAKFSANGTYEGEAMSTAFQEQEKLQSVLIEKADQLSEADQKRAQYLLDINKKLAEQAEQAGKIADEQERDLSALEKQQTYVALNRVRAKTKGTDENKSKAAQAAQLRIAEAQKNIKDAVKQVELINSASSRLESTMQSVNNTFKNGGKISQQTLNNIKNLAQTKLDELKESGYTSGAAIDSLNNIIQKCGISVNNFTEEDIKYLDSEIESLSSSTGELDAKLMENGDLVNNLAIAYSGTKKATAETKQEAKLFTEQVIATTGAVQNQADSLERLKNHGQNAVDIINTMDISAATLSQKLTTASTAIMQVASAINALKSIGNIWADEDIEFGEKILQTMMSMGMIIPIVTTLLKTKTVATALDTIAENIHAGALQVSAVSAWALTHPIIVLTALLLAIVAVIALVASSQKKWAEQLEATAEAANKENEAAQKELETNTKLVQSYNEVLEAQDGTAESKAKLREAALEMVDALDIENGALLVQKENYEAITKAAREAAAEQAKEARLAAKSALSSNFDLARNDKKFKKYDVGQGKSYFTGDLSGTEYNYFQQILKQGQQEGKYQNLELFSTGGYYDLRGANNTSSPYAFLQNYQDLQEFLKEIYAFSQENGLGLEKGDGYTSIQTYLKDLSEQYEKLLPNLTDEFNSTLQNVLFSNPQITSIEEYDKILEQAINSLREMNPELYKNRDAAEQAAEAWFKLNKETSDIAQQKAALEQLHQATGKSIQQLQYYIDKYGDLVYKVSPNMFASEEALQAALKVLQDEADRASINIQLKTYREMQKDWKESMSADEVDDFFSKYADEFDTEEKKLNFLNLGYQRQQDWLFYAQANAIKTAYSEEGLEDYQNDIEAAIKEAQKAAEKEESIYQANKLGFDNLTEEEIKRENDRHNAWLEANNKYIEQLNAELEQSKTEEYKEYSQLLGETERQNLIASQLSGIDNLDDLDTTLGKITSAGLDIPINQLADALTNVAEKYKNTTVEIQNYHDAVLNGDTESILAAEDALRAATRIGEAAEKYGLSAESLEIQAKQIKAANKEMELSAEMAARMAVANQRMNKGVTALNKDFDTWRKTLETADHKSQEYADTAAKVTDAIRDLVNASDDFELPVDFLQSAENLQLLEEAAKGSERAINLLGLKLAEAAVQASEFNESVASTFNDTILAIDEKGFEAAQQAVINGIQNIRDHLDQLMNGTMTLDDIFSGSATNWINNLNKMAVATGMSVAQMNDLLNQLGVQADINIITAKEQMQVPTEDIYYENLPEKDLFVPMPVSAETASNEKNFNKAFETPQQVYRAVRKIVAPGPMYTVEGYRQIAQIGTTKDVKKPKVHYTGVGGGARAGGVSSSSTRRSSSGGSGGSSKHDTASRKNFNDEKERYHWLNEELDDLTREYDKLSKAKDRAFGKNRINLINQEIAALDKLAKHNQSYLKEIQKNQASDLNSLMNGTIKTYTSNDESGMLREYAVKGLYGYGFGADSFDEHGNLINYDDILQAAADEYNRAVERYNSLDADLQTAAEKDLLLEAELQYESLKELIEIYEETNNLYQDKLEEILENFRQQQDARLEALQYELELKISFNDADLKRLEYERKMLADDMFKAVEYLRTIWNGGSGGTDWALYQQRASDVLSHASQLLGTSHGDIVIDGDGNIISNPDLSDEGWVDALRNAEDEIYNTIDALWELDDTMCHYYEETLQKGEEKLDQYMSKMEDCTKVLQHFQTISELLGKEDDYEWMGEILKGQRDAIKNELESAQLQFAYAQQQYDEMMQRYEATKNQVSEGTRQKMEDELQAQYEVMVKWQEKMYEKTEEYAQASIALYENMIKQQSKILEDAMTGGLGFDSLLDSMQNVSSTQDMILTKTNQLYETNKLMRSISQDIDKTNNLSAKNRLASFKSEIENMQKLNTMSKFDLEIAQARYKLLLAQIALEEARNAKSTVRLQRDNEGNFGYVYTADQDKINDAAQNLADRENDLYNLSLEKANANAQALIQLDKELHDELERIAIEYRGNDEKIQEEQARVREEYAKKRQQIEADYLTALYWLNETSSTDISEAWSTNYQDMILSANEWQIAVDEYVVAVNDIYEEWRRDMDENITPSIGENLDTLKQKIGDVLEQSEEYEDWFNDFAAENYDRLSEISKITNEYYQQRDAILALIQSLMDYCAQIDEAIRAAAEFEAAQQAAAQTPNVPEQTQTPVVNNGSYTPTGDTGGNDTGGYVPPDDDDNTKPEKTYWVCAWRMDGGTESLTGQKYVSDSTFSGVSYDEALIVFNNALPQLGSKWAKLAIYKRNVKVKETEYDFSNNDSFGIDVPGHFDSEHFASGGYTGSWTKGSDVQNGKLAFLHQKELVLNQDDTENFLNAVKLVRSISQAIDLRAAASSLGGGINSPSLFNSTGGFEQNVTIHAEFPNAQDHNEIEEAFNNLMNRAAQFVGRPRT